MFKRASMRKSLSGVGDNAQLDITGLPNDAQEVLREFDLDGSGAIDLAELAAAARAYKAQQDKNRLLKIAILLLGVLFLVICGTMTGLTWAVVDSLKDDDVEDSSAMVARNTEANSQTTSSDYVTINGKQVPRSYINRLVAEADGTAPATTTTERRLRSARRNKSRRSLTQADDPYYTDNYYSYYYYESIYDFYSPTGTGTFDPSYDPQAYDKPGDATVDDLTPGMMDDIIMHGPAMACAPSYRHMFLDSMMNTDALANLARVTIIQGPLYYTFSVRSASAVPRCALQASANYDSHPCEIYDQLLPSDMVVTIGLEGVGTIMLDRTKIIFPWFDWSAMWGLQQRGFKVMGDTIEGAIIEGWFNNVPMMGDLVCPDGAPPDKDTGVCPEAYAQATEAQNYYPVPMIGSAHWSIPVKLPGSKDGMSGLNHWDKLEHLESVAIVPYKEEGYACNPDATISLTEQGGEIWRLIDLGTDFFFADMYNELADGTREFIQPGNMEKVRLRRDGTTFTPRGASLCRFGAFPEGYTPTIPGLPKNGIYFAARSSTTGPWGIYALDLGVDRNDTTANNVVLVSNLNTTVRPAGLFFDAKGQAIYVTVENRLLEIDVGPITFSLPVNPVTIVNVANQTVKVSSPNTLIDDLPGFEDGTTRGDAILRGPQGIGGRILGGDPESPCGIEGCLIVADRENRRLRLVGPDGVVTAVGDGNFVCNGAPDYPKLSETVGPINPDGSPAPPPPPCSADGKVPMSVDGFMDPVEVGGLGGWARWPENLAEMVYPDGWPMMIADVDMPMQVAVDVAQDFNGDPSRPPFHIWFTERTSSGSLLRVIDQDGYIMTMANPGMADMPPPMEFSDPTIEGTESTATMPPPPQIRSFSLAGKRMMFVMEDGHLGRVELSYSASMDPGFIEEGYNPDAPYATEDVRKRRR